MAAALDGIRVLEIGDDIAVRYCGRLFATAGAVVLQAGGERPAADSPAARAYASWLDAGKHQASTPDAEPPFDLIIGGLSAIDRDRARRLAAELPGRPVVMLLSWFGDDGPYAGWQGNDAIVQAMAGLAYSFGLPEGPPLLAQGHSPQIVCGVTAFIAALAGLISEAARPARIDINVFEASLCFAETGAVAAAASGVQSRRLGVNRFVPTYPCSIYPTLDGCVGVTALIPAQWAALVRLIGRPDLDGDVRFATTFDRLMNGDLVDEILRPCFARRTTADWVGDGDRERIPITPVPRPGEMPFVEHWSTRGAFAPLSDDPGAPRGPTLPYRITWAGETTAKPAGGPAGPLAGIRVADFSMGWAGPLAGRYLGDLGADVLKIESSVRPDWWRGWEDVGETDRPAHEIQGNFLAVNRNKRGLDLDLTTPQAAAQARAIVACADVTIENLGPGVMARLGLGPADQRALHPGIISVAMPPFGKTGPLAGLRAYGSTVEQASGLPYTNGFEDWPPCLQHVAFGDPVAGLYAAAAALLGLHGRTRLGGAEIELCQVECLFQLGAEAIIAEQVTGAPSHRTGSRRAEMTPCCVVAAEGFDQWLAVAVDCDAAWQGLCRALARDDWAGDPGLATAAGRAARADELEAAIAAWAVRRPASQAASMLQAHGVAAAPVTPASALAADDHLAQADYWTLQHRRYVGEHLTPAPPFRFDGTRPPARRAAPLLGEHTEEVLIELAILRR